MEPQNELIRLLLCDPDERLCQLLTMFLQSRGFSVLSFTDGDAAMHSIRNDLVDICVTEIDVPGLNGKEMLKRVMVENPDLPFVFLTTHGLIEDIVEGYTLGCADYVVKPFSMEVLSFRLKSIMHRYGRTLHPDGIYQIGRFVFNASRHELCLDKGKPRRITTRESEVLRLLCDNVGDIVNRKYVLQRLWKDDTYFTARSMDVIITRLRHHLASDPRIAITNVYSRGFRLTVLEEDPN